MTYTTTDPAVTTFFINAYEAQARAMLGFGMEFMVALVKDARTYNPFFDAWMHFGEWTPPPRVAPWIAYHGGHLNLVVVNAPKAA